MLQLVANDAQGQFDNSLVQIHYPERTSRLNEFSLKMGQTTELPSVEEIEMLWFELQREMTESGKLALSKQTVLTNDGQEVDMEVLRIGTFNLLANQKYIQRIPETGRIVEYPRQPSGRYMGGAKQLMSEQGNVVAFTVDPIRGQLISLLSAAPDLTERVQQGGVIGYVIVSLGVLVILLALGRFAFCGLKIARYNINYRICKTLVTMRLAGLFRFTSKTSMKISNPWNLNWEKRCCVKFRKLIVGCLF